MLLLYLCVLKNRAAQQCWAGLDVYSRSPVLAFAQFVCTAAESPPQHDWPLQVSDLLCCGTTAFGLESSGTAVDVWAIDLGQVAPFGQPRRPATGAERRRLSEYAAAPLVLAPLLP